jgi:phosphatidylglycerophosphate synthase
MFDEDAKQSIVNYKYQGGDSSPIYQHILSPLAQWCVDTLVPAWMAPNVITALGLSCSFVAMVLTLIYNPSLGPNAPRWLHLVTACSVFLYQTLDNMDGKQARKTGSSSALGMFFDHGCDAMNAGITVISFSSVLATGWGGKQFFTYFSCFILFYFQTWEEYYVGSMVLPPFNGPTEGLTMAYIVGLMSFFFGSEIFQTVSRSRFYLLFSLFWTLLYLSIVIIVALQALFELPGHYLFHETDLLNTFGLPTAERPQFTPFNIIFLIVVSSVICTCVGQVIRGTV